MNDKTLTYMDKKILSGKATKEEKQAQLRRLNRGKTISRILAVVVFILFLFWTYTAVGDGFSWLRLVQGIIYIVLFTVIFYFSFSSYNYRIRLILNAEMKKNSQ